MRLLVANSMRDRLDGASALADWASAYTQGAPRVLVGYREPIHADDWPFVSLVPARDRRDLIKGTLDGMLMVLACGVRDQDPAGDGSAGLAMVDALAEVALGVLIAPLVYSVSIAQAVGAPRTYELIADSANLTDSILIHPNYQLEIGITLNILGGADV